LNSYLWYALVLCICVAILGIIGRTLLLCQVSLELGVLALATAVQSSIGMCIARQMHKDTLIISYRNLDGTSSFEML
jgi:hypothetical protein